MPARDPDDELSQLDRELLEARETKRHFRRTAIPEWARRATRRQLFEDIKNSEEKGTGGTESKG